jgi:hypothetical protein
LASASLVGLEIHHPKFLICCKYQEFRVRKEIVRAEGDIEFGYLVDCPWRGPSSTTLHLKNQLRINNSSILFNPSSSTQSTYSRDIGVDINLWSILRSRTFQKMLDSAVGLHGILHFAAGASG